MRNNLITGQQEKCFGANAWSQFLLINMAYIHILTYGNKGQEELLPMPIMRNKIFIVQC